MTEQETVSMMNGKGREIKEIKGKRRAGVECEQETRWKGNGVIMLRWVLDVSRVTRIRNVQTRKRAEPGMQVRI